MALPGIPWRPTYQPSAHPSMFGSASRKAASHGWVAQARASRRWAVVGATVGALIALVVFAPAHWLAQAVATATQQRVLLANAHGTVWSGDAVLILGAGAGSRDARALPGRIRWTLRPTGTAVRLALQHDCCLNGEQVLLVHPGFGQVQVSVQAGKADQGDWVGQWPAAWLVGLGTPWNTLRPGGALRLTTQALSLRWAQGRFAMAGSAGLELRDFSSRLTTLPRLGSYRVTLSGDPAQAGTALVTLETLDGALRLSGTGSWSRGGLRLRGEATATDADRPALNNLLNIIGRRQGARSLLTIG
jgi:general secretion pathway protein N